MDKKDWDWEKEVDKVIAPAPSLARLQLAATRELIDLLQKVHFWVRWFGIIWVVVIAFLVYGVLKIEKQYCTHFGKMG